MPNIPINPMRTFLGLAPKEISKVAQVQIQFNAVGAAIDFDFMTEAQDNVFTSVQSAWIDNKANGGMMTLTVQGTNQKIYVPSGAVGMFPVIALAKLAFSAVHETDSALVTCHFLNVPQPYFVYTPL